MSPVFSLQLVAPGTPPETALLERLRHEVGAGRDVWYLVGDADVRRRRRTSLRELLPAAHGCVHTPRSLALCALEAAGEPAAPPGDPAVLEGLLEQALERALPAMPRGPGRMAAAARVMEQLLGAGWSADALQRALTRMEMTDAPGPVDALWRALRAHVPAVDPERPLRLALDGGALRRAAPDALLIEGWALRDELQTRAVVEAVRAVRDGGGAVLAVCLHVHAPGGGPRARMARLLRDLGAQLQWAPELLVASAPLA